MSSSLCHCGEAGRLLHRPILVPSRHCPYEAFATSPLPASQPDLAESSYTRPASLPLAEILSAEVGGRPGRETGMVLAEPLVSAATTRASRMGYPRSIPTAMTCHCLHSIDEQIEAQKHEAVCCPGAHGDQTGHVCTSAHLVVWVFIFFLLPPCFSFCEGDALVATREYPCDA